MDSKERAELTSKTETESQQYESSITAGGGGTEQKGKRTHGHGQQCSDFGD